jgi:hypothetical protein
MSKPESCLNVQCKGEDFCAACINRNIIAKKGYELIQAIEELPASLTQTKVVTTACDFITLAEKEFLKAKKESVVINSPECRDYTKG